MVYSSDWDPNRQPRNVLLLLMEAQKGFATRWLSYIGAVTFWKAERRMNGAFKKSPNRGVGASLSVLGTPALNPVSFLLPEPFRLISSCSVRTAT